MLEQELIDESFQIGTRQSMFITDLEGNQFEIFTMKQQQIRLLKSNQLCLKDLISEDLEPHQGLAAGSYLAHVQLKQTIKKK